MPSTVRVKIVSAPKTPNDLWVCDALLAKPGDTVSWESAREEMILFIPSKSLFEGPGILPDQRVFELTAAHNYRLELKLKVEIGRPEEAIMIPYAAFRVPAEEVSDVAMRAKMIIKR